MSTTPEALANDLTDYGRGFPDGPGLFGEAAAELRRLAAVEAERDELKRGLALVQQHHATAWNRGHEAGMRANRDIAKQATDAVQRDAWGNSQLTEALLAAEAERDQLRAEVEALRADAERWQPIETAPRDGQRVLVWIEEKRFSGCAFAKLWFYGTDGRLGGGVEGFSGDWNITHWAPLTAPPAA